MPLWRRKSAVPEERDADFPSLTRSQAQRMYAMSLQALADRGYQALIADGVLVRSDGHRIGMTNLARDLAGLESERDWQAWIDQRFDGMLASDSRGTTLAGGPVDDIIARAYTRLYPSDWLPDGMVEKVYHRELMPGILELLVEDFPESIQPYPPDVIAACGVQRLLDAAAVNLAKVKPESRDRVDDIEVFSGSSFYLSSLVRDVPWIARNWLDDADIESSGVLVAVPERSCLMFHLPRSKQSLEQSWTQMVTLTARMFGERPGPISQSVYWWHQHEFHQILEVQPDGESVHLTIPPHLESLIHALPD